MASRHSEDLLLRRSVGRLELTPSRLSRSEVTEIMSYKDLIAALEDSRRECASLCSPNEQNAGTRLNDDSSPSSSPSSTAEYTDSDPFSSQLYGALESREERAESPPTSVSSDSDSEEDHRTTRNGGIRIPLPPLVELGIHVPIRQLSGTEGYSYTMGPLDQTATRDVFVPSRSAVQMRRRSFPIHFERPQSFLDLSSSDDEDAGSESGSYNFDDEPESELAPHLTYTERQVSLFGDFLRAPFSSVSSGGSQTIGTGPFDTEEHAPCECDSCFLVDVALTREFSELHPIASWHDSEDYDSEPDSESE